MNLIQQTEELINKLSDIDLRIHYKQELERLTFKPTEYEPEIIDPIADEIREMFNECLTLPSHKSKVWRFYGDPSKKEGNVFTIKHHQEEVRKNDEKRNKKWRSKMKQKGFCTRCGLPCDINPKNNKPYYHCKVHREYINSKRRKNGK